MHLDNLLSDAVCGPAQQLDICCLRPIHKLIQPKQPLHLEQMHHGHNHDFDSHHGIQSIHVTEESRTTNESKVPLTRLNLESTQEINHIRERYFCFAASFCHITYNIHLPPSL